MDFLNSFLEYLVPEEEETVEKFLDNTKNKVNNKNDAIKKLKNFNKNKKTNENIKTDKNNENKTDNNKTVKYIKSITKHKYNRILNNHFTNFLINNYNFTSDNNTFCTVNNKGKHSLNFSNVHYKTYLQKKYIMEIFNGNPYFLKSYFIDNKKEFDELKLEDKIYFFKLTYGAGSYNVGVAKGKKLMTNLQRLSGKFPLIIQEGCENIRLNNGKKEDERVYVLILKFKDKIEYYFYNKSLVRQCVKNFNSKEFREDIYLTNNSKNNGQSKKYFKDIEKESMKKLFKSILPLIPINKTLEHESELLLLGFDIIFNNNNEPRVIEVNNDPMLCNNPLTKKIHYEMFTEIYEYLINKKSFKKFINVF